MAVKAGCPASTKTTVNTQKYPSAPAMAIDTSKTYTATVVTTAGTFDIALDAKTAPTTVNNFVFLANKGYYHCVIFHRVIPQFMDQTGDPTRHRARADPGYTIPDENPPKAANPRSSTRSGRWPWPTRAQPNSGGSQFFIVAGPQGESLPNTLRAVRAGDLGHERGRHHQPAGFRPGRPARRHPAHHLRHHPRNAKDTQTMATPTAPAADGSSPQQRKFDEEPPMFIDTTKRYVATMVTSHGTMVIALDPLAAPKTVNSFVFLARYHYYDGIVFHRIIPGFVLQGGDPTGSGSGGPGYRFDDELPAAGALQGRLAGHGQRRAQHQRQPVLRHQRSRRGAPAAALLALRRGRHRARRRGEDQRRRQPLRARRPSGS